MSKRKGHVRTVSGWVAMLIIVISLVMTAIGFALGYHVGFTTAEIQ